VIKVRFDMFKARFDLFKARFSFDFKARFA
jgi:hypothetical protein